MAFVCRVILTLCSLVIATSLLAEPVRLGMTIPRSALASASTVQSCLDTIQASGAKQVRLAADWQQIQPRADQWNFSRLDAAVQAAKERDLAVVLVFGPTPRWAVSYLGPNPSAEEVNRARPDLPAYRAYVTKVVQRYQNRVTRYQVWERPSGTTLLALPKDVIGMYRAGARAVHAVNPALCVIAPEPGDVDISWIAEYLQVAQGSERADVLSLSAIRPTLTPRSLHWHLQVLRQRILSKRPAPSLWFEVAARNSHSPADFLLASLALCEGISTITIAGEASEALVQRSARFFAALHGHEYTGWTQLTPDVLSGVFTGSRGRVLLALPLASDTLRLSADAQASSDIPVPGGTAVISTPTASPTTLSVATPVTLPVASLSPVLITGVQLPAKSGSPQLRTVPVRGTSVSLDMTGKDQTAIHALPTLPGGRFNKFTRSDGHTVLSTVRDTAPWIHFDVPDGFLFYNTERTPIEVTIQVFGATERNRVGFNLYYDAVGGMTNSSWQWIDVGPRNIFTYTLRLNDAIFAGREGYDLRLNMGGSDDSIRVVNLVIKKVSASTINSQGKR